LSFNYLRAVLEMTPAWTTPAELACLLLLANYADHDGECFPSQATLAKKLRVGPKQVQRITRALQEMGLIEIVSGASPRGGLSYRLVFEPVRKDRETPDVQVHSPRPTLDTDVHSRIGHSGHLNGSTLDIRGIDYGHQGPSTLDVQVHLTKREPVQEIQRREPRLRRSLSEQEISFRKSLTNAAKQLLTIEKIEVDTVEDLAARVIRALPEADADSLTRFSLQDESNGQAYVQEAINFTWSAHLSGLLPKFAAV
jgi:hypothetical protein